MFLKRTETRSRYFLHLAALSIVVALFAGLAKRTAFSDVLLPKEINARTVIEQLSDALAEGRRESGKHLSRLGFATEVEEIQRLDNTQLFAFSSDTMIETLYRRAEAQSEGEGDRFLAVLYNDAKKTSAALAIDPDFGYCPTKKLLPIIRQESRHDP
jgi:hypothetical protein